MSVTLRTARPTDAGATGDILWQGLPEAEGYSRAETLAFCGTMIERGWMTVAEADGQVAGFLAQDGAEICALYVAPAARGRGLGQRLLAAAQHRAGHLHLSSRAEDARAQHFYVRAGFRPAQRDGGPQIRYEWTRKAAA